MEMQPLEAREWEDGESVYIGPWQKDGTVGLFAGQYDQVYVNQTLWEMEK